jgi:glutamate 5-kinase
MDAAVTRPDAAARFAPAACARLVVKIGSSLLVDSAGAVRREWLASVVDDIAERRAAGQEIVVVSSGAIALGARRLKLDKGGRASLEDAQAAAAVGQVALSAVWEALLSDKGLTMAQVLLTLDDLEDRRRYLNAAATLDRLLALGTVPVLNENDTVATTEIRFGDNDRLAARAAQAAGAQGVILLSDVDGLYTGHPGRDPEAKLVPEVKAVTHAIEAMASADSGSGLGTGGMAAKLAAAKIAGAGHPPRHRRWPPGASARPLCRHRPWHGVRGGRSGAGEKGLARRPIDGCRDAGARFGGGGGAEARQEPAGGRGHPRRWPLQPRRCRGAGRA